MRLGLFEMIKDLHSFRRCVVFQVILFKTSRSLAYILFLNEFDEYVNSPKNSIKRAPHRCQLCSFLI